MSGWLWKVKSTIYHYLRRIIFISPVLEAENNSARTLLRSVSLPDIKIAVDIGTGKGNALKLIPENTALVVGIDFCRLMLEKKQHCFPQVNFILADALRLPIKNSNCELALCIGVSEYLNDRYRLLTQIKTLLKSGGYCLFTISPKCLYTYLRFISGHRLYPVNESQIELEFRELGFTVIDQMKTMMQVQYLIQK